MAHGIGSRRYVTRANFRLTRSAYESCFYYASCVPPCSCTLLRRVTIIILGFRRAVEAVHRFRRIAFSQIRTAAMLRVRNIRRSRVYQEGPDLIAEITRCWESDVVQVGVPYRGTSWVAVASHNADQPMFKYDETRPGHCCSQ